VAFGTQTVSRLLTTLKGFIPAATITLLLGGLLGEGIAISGATLSFMGLALGNLAGLPLGRWLGKRLQRDSDRRLPLVLALVFLPLALLPAQPTMAGLSRLDFHGWTPVLLGVVMAFPLGVATGSSWALHAKTDQMAARSKLVWNLCGVGLGLLVGLGASLIVSMFQGAFLVNLFTAPMVWPTLPDRGDRSLLVRMLLTLVVLLSTMFLLFL
jgi:hypothetical protein